jgi:hypothetical protein
MDPERELSPEKLVYADGTKHNRNLLTSLETSSYLKYTSNMDIATTIYDKKPSKKRIQAPYMTRAAKKAGGHDFVGI